MFSGVQNAKETKKGGKMNAIEVKSLRKEYGTLTAVNDITFEVGEGTLFALLGVNGAGKTTTIKMLTGLAVPTSGDAAVLGHSIKTELSQVKQLVNLSTQETSVAGRLTVRENLEFIAGVYGLPEIKKKAQEIIDRFGMNDVAEKRAKTLSGGWQRKLSIAMGVITGPKVLFLDEPSLGLDVLARRELWKVIRELKESVTIVLTTHYMEEAEALADRIAVMVSGDIKAIGTLKELQAQTGKETLEDIFIEIAGGGEL